MDCSPWGSSVTCLKFSGQEYWCGLLFPSPRDLPDPGIEPGLLHCRWILYCLSHEVFPTISLMYDKNKYSECINSYYKNDNFRFMRFLYCWFLSSFYALSHWHKHIFSFYSLVKKPILPVYLYTSSINRPTIRFLIQCIIIFSNPVSVRNKHLTCWCCVFVKRLNGVYFIHFC